jgi:hypothetical protein
LPTRYRGGRKFIAEIVVPSEKDQVSQSYGRCCLSSGFFDDFYQTFFNSSPRVRAKFANTDMAKQKSLLRDGITYMIMFFDGSGVAASKVTRLAASQGPAQYRARPVQILARFPDQGGRPA